MTAHSNNENSEESPESAAHCSLMLTLTIAQERMLLDHSKMGIIKLQDGKVVYANRKAVQLCKFGFVDDLLYKPREEVLSETSCKVLDEWLECNPYLPALDTLKSIRPAGTARDLTTWVMPSIFHGQFCLQLMFMADENNNEGLAGREQETEEKNTAELVSEALQKERFRILFQPVACLGEGSEAHYDVMLRMKKPEGNEITAGEFMGDIDTHPIAGKIDRWVVLQALKSLLTARNQTQKAHLFIHLSSASAQDQTFPPWLFQIIRKSGVSPDSLIFQLAESTVNKYQKESKRLLRSTKNLGCRNNICHFGLLEHPLSFSLLEDIDCDYVKLHNAFTRELIDNRNSEQDVREMVKKLHGMNLKTIVPHVETPSVMTQLWRCGVDYVQGYFLQKPKETMDYDFSSDG